jgi:hypothetical protein
VSQRQVFSLFFVCLFPLQKLNFSKPRFDFLDTISIRVKISPIDRVIKFANKFLDEILDKSQLQRFLDSLNYVADFYQNLRKQCKPLFDRLQTNPPSWTSVHTSIVQDIKKYVKTLPCLGIPTINSFKIVETNASDIGYGGILKQRISPDSSKQIV